MYCTLRTDVVCDHCRSKLGTAPVRVLNTVHGNSSSAFPSFLMQVQIIAIMKFHHKVVLRARNCETMGHFFWMLWPDIIQFGRVFGCC